MCRLLCSLLLPAVLFAGCAADEAADSATAPGWELGLEGDQPLAPPGLVFDQDPLVPGQPAGFRVVGAAPGDLIKFAMSTEAAGPGPCLPPLGGLCLGIQAPVTLLGQATADGSGRAELIRDIPANAPNIFVFTQAVVDRDANSVATNVITAPILAGALDLDLDGYCGGEVCADPSAYPGDCADDNPSVNPGNVAWHDSPYWTGTKWSYDYDCDGSEVKRYRSLYTCDANGGLPTCPSTAGWSSSVPACGSDAYWDRGCLEIPYLPICAPVDSSIRTQSCR